MGLALRIGARRMVQESPMYHFTHLLDSLVLRGKLGLKIGGNETLCAGSVLGQNVLLAGAIRMSCVFTVSKEDNLV